MTCKSSTDRSNLFGKFLTDLLNQRIGPLANFACAGTKETLFLSPKRGFIFIAGQPYFYSTTVNVFSMFLLIAFGTSDIKA